jgi:hypothetical protein
MWGSDPDKLRAAAREGFFPSEDEEWATLYKALAAAAGVAATAAATEFALTGVGNATDYIYF